MARYSGIRLAWILAGWAALAGAADGPQLSTNGPAADSPNPEAVAGDPGTAPVDFRGGTLFQVTTPIGELSVTERAAAIEQRLLDVAGGPSAVLEQLRATDRDGLTEIYGGDTLIRTVTDQDALGTGRTRRQLAADQVLAIHNALAIEFRDRGTASLLRGALIALAATALLTALMVVLRRSYRWTRTKITRAAQSWHWDSGLARLRLLSPETVAGTTRSFVATVAWLIALLLVYFYLEFTLSLFPWTRGIADSMVQTSRGAVIGALTSLAGYLPSLLNIIVIVFIARLALKILRRLFEQVQAQRINLPNFYPEWALPTYSLVRFFLLAVSAVMIFPYLPGSGSEGFKGVSVFVGLLISLGAASAIANLIAGIVITYMRPFKVGDRVKIADAVGDVMSKDLFVVRVRTTKNVDITIPNSLVLANHIINYSSSADSAGLVLHTTVTIGYDVPWQQVEQLLLAAARKVEGILAEPEPYVLQTSLDDFFVSYELNAYTNRPNEMARLYSRLHTEIQNSFNEAGVEIMSPHYAAVRDGNRAALPDEHLPKDYRTPGFNVFSQILRPGGGS